MEEEEISKCLAAPGAERRTRPRFPVDEDASLLLLEHGFSVQCSIVDLSLEGCRVRTRERLPAAMRASVEISFKINGIAFRLSGEIRWLDSAAASIRDGVRVVGIRFVGVSSRRRDEWAEVLGEVEVDSIAKAAQRGREQTGARQWMEERKAEPPESPTKRYPYLVAALQPAKTMGADRPSAGSSQALMPEPAVSPLASHETIDAAGRDAANRERRKQSRHEVNTSAVILLIHVGSRLSGRILDLSLGGCRICTEQNFPVGIYTRVETEFQLEGLPFRLGGVIQAIHSPRLVGIRFLDMSDRKREQVEQLIEEIAEIEAIKAINTTHARHNLARIGDAAEIAGEVPGPDISPSGPAGITNHFDR
jgi:hypothetical protein